ncbi:MAG: hypothetical protein H0U24_05960 [Thermoleophilaceae bacterium]|nr:hypothetical protein [Thermoleophilaceae bacterium]
MSVLLSVAVWIAEGRSENPGSAGKIAIIVGIILSLVLLASLGLWLVHRFGATKTRSLDEHEHSAGRVGRGGKERKS